MTTNKRATPPRNLNPVLRETWENIIDNSGKWFTLGNMRFFSTVISWQSLTQIDQETYGFITSEQDTFASSQNAWDGQRRYSVRKFTKTNGIDPLSEFGEFATPDTARHFLRNAGWVVACPNHGGAYDCTPFCELCGGNQETTRERVNQ